MNKYVLKNVKTYTNQLATHNVVHLCLFVETIKDIADLHRSFCNKKWEQRAVQMHTICISDKYHDYILDETYPQDQIENERIIN